MKEFLRTLLLYPDANSRFITLVTGCVTAFCTLFLTVAFVFDNNRVEYSEMMLIMLSGGVVGGGFARFLTKKVSLPNGNTEKSTEAGK